MRWKKTSSLEWRIFIAMAITMAGLDMARRERVLTSAGLWYQDGQVVDLEGQARGPTCYLDCMYNQPRRRD